MTSRKPASTPHGASADLTSLSHNDVTILAETFRLLGDPSRLKIMRLLRGARLVKGARQAKQIFYEVADQHVSQVLLDMAIHIAEDHNDE